MEKVALFFDGGGAWDTCFNVVSKKEIYGCFWEGDVYAHLSPYQEKLLLYSSYILSWVEFSYF